MDAEWLQALGTLTTGLYVLTSGQGEDVGGMIQSWVSQVSYEPVLIMAAVHPNRYTHGLIQRSGAFGLHSISRDEPGLLSRFKGPDPKAKLAGLDWVRGATGVPVVRDCLACFECTVRSSLTPGNHTMYIGEVVRVWNFSSARPMCSLDHEHVYIGRD
jgi:flavin reductase (DIM6/NTAB) family NADH-FMN oxidoreductase RutF